MIKRSKADLIYEPLRDELLQLPVGSPAGSIRKLMHRYETSQLSITRVLGRLEREGVLERHPDGTLFLRGETCHDKKRIGVLIPDWPSATFAEVEEKIRYTGNSRDLLVHRISYPINYSFRQLESTGFDAFLLIPDRVLTPEDVYYIGSCPIPLVIMVAVSCQYDFLDDYYSGAHDQESNFGLLRGDYSRKPSYYALQRMNSLLGDSAADLSAKVTVTAMPLQRSAVRQTIVSDWDNARIMATNGIRTYAFTNPEEEKMLAVWSMQPYSKEANNRVISLEIDGWKEYDAPPVVINLMNGDTCDLPVKRENGKILIENLELKEAPLLIKFFRNSR